MPAGSGFTAALVDVVLHEGNDLLELVVQLSATCGGVRLQRVHHLTGGDRKRKYNKDDFQRLLSVHASKEREEISHLPGHRTMSERKRAQRNK